MQSFLLGDAYYHFYNAVLQAFAAMLGALVIGVIFRLGYIERFLNDKTRELNSLLDEIDDGAVGTSDYNPISAAGRILNNSNGEELSNSDLSRRKRLVQILVDIDLQIARKELFRKKIKAPMIITFSVIFLSAYMLLFDDVLPYMAIFMGANLAVVFVIFGLFIYWDFIMSCFVRNDSNESCYKIKDDILDRMNKPEFKDIISVWKSKR